jgi:hypothetical protein
MRFYTVERLSPKISETPEGFLLCENVPVARTGEMMYKAGEVPVKDRGGVVRIKRTEDVVFDDVTISSFEGKPITLDHPDDFVTPENWQQLAHGTVQNVRRGEGEQSDLLLADLLVTTEKAIRLVKGGLREVSCGYDADYAELEEGLGEQRNIVGNHVALVDKGRAGSRCAIGDKACTNCGKCECKNRTEDEGMKMKIKSKVMDAIKRIKDAVEAEIGALPDDKDNAQTFKGKPGATPEPPAGKSESIGKVVEGVKVLSGDKKMKDRVAKLSKKGVMIKDDGEEGFEGESPVGEEVSGPISEIKEKVDELVALVEQIDTEEGSEGSEPIAEEAPVEEGVSEIQDEEEAPAEEEAPVEEGESGGNAEILARLDKLEAVIAELVKSDEEVHAAMDSIMNGEGGEKEEKPLPEDEPTEEKKEVEDEDPDLEDKKDEEVEKEKDKTMDSASWNELSYRVGILAPEMNISRPTKKYPHVVEVIKREALKKAFTTDMDSVKPFVRGKNINNLTGDRLDAAFVGASELIAKLNNGRVQQKSHKFYDAGTEVANSVRAINEMNKKFWKR